MSRKIREIEEGIRDLEEELETLPPWKEEEMDDIIDKIDDLKQQLRKLKRREEEEDDDDGDGIYSIIGLGLGPAMDGHNFGLGGGFGGFGGGKSGGGGFGGGW